MNAHYLPLACFDQLLQVTETRSGEPGREGNRGDFREQYQER